MLDLSRVADTATAISPDRSANTLAGLRRALSWVLREPFFQFIVLGVLLFAIGEYLEARSQFARIEISRAQIEGITNNYRLQYGASPTSEQLNSLIDQFIKEEVFYHEALRLQLDRDDEIIRRRLVQKYEFLQQDLAVPSDPTDAELRNFYKNHADNYRIPERLTFSHIYFSVDGRGDAAARASAASVLADLQRSTAIRAPSAGDSFPGTTDYADATPAQVRRAFGASEFSDQLFSLAPGHWFGPYRSGFGWHLVHIDARKPAEISAYDAVRDLVRRDYSELERGQRNAEAVEHLKKHFVIIRE